MKIHFTIELINPKGCRVTRLGSPLPLGLFTNTGQLAQDQSRPGTKAADVQSATQMKYRNHGFILPEYASKARPAEAGLLSVASGKLHSGKAALVRLAGPTIQAHATTVTAVTYSDPVTLIMCRYSASSKSEARQALLPESLGFIRAGSASSRVKTNKVGKATNAKIHAAEQSRSTTGPHRCPTTSMFGLFRAAITTPKLKEFNYLQTVTSTV